MRTRIRFGPNACLMSKRPKRPAIRLPQRHVHVFIMITAGDDLPARHPDIDTNLEWATLMEVLLQHLDGYPAADDMGMGLFELDELGADTGLECLGVLHTARDDLQWNLNEGSP